MCKKYVFLYEKKMLNYKSNGSPLSATWEEIKDISIMNRLENLKIKAQEKGAKFKYKLKPHSMFKKEGKIIIKAPFTKYQVYKLLDEILSGELELNIK